MIRRASRYLYRIILQCEFRRLYRRGEDYDSVAAELQWLEP